MRSPPKEPDALDRIPPHDVAIEQALLGALLMNNACLDQTASVQLEPGHFYEPIHQKVFEVCKTLIEEGKPASPLTLRAYLPEEMHVTSNTKFTMAQYLARLASEATSLINAIDYATTIKDLAARRAVIDIARRLADGGYTGEADLRIAFEDLDVVRMHAFKDSHMTTSATIAQTVVRTVDNFARLYQNEAPIAGVPTGLAVLDGLIGGFQPGELIIGAGRPGMGKTTFGASVARQAAARGYGVGFFSLEMPELQIGCRFVADALYDRNQMNPLEYKTIMRARCGAFDVPVEAAQKIIDAGRDVEHIPLLMDYSSSPSVGEIAAKVRGMAARMRKKFDTRLGLVIIDYLKFIRASDRYSGNKNLEVGETTGALKTLARDMGIPVLLLCQMNREVEKRADRRPQLADLRDSGELEQDADTVMFFFREAYYLENLSPEERNNVEYEDQYRAMCRLMEIIVAKQRMGPTGSVSIHAHMGAGAVRDIQTEINPPHAQFPDSL